MIVETNCDMSFDMNVVKSLFVQKSFVMIESKKLTFVFFVRFSTNETILFFKISTKNHVVVIDINQNTNSQFDMITSFLFYFENDHRLFQIYNVIREQINEIKNDNFTKLSSNVNRFFFKNRNQNISKIVKHIQKFRNTIFSQNFLTHLFLIIFASHDDVVFEIIVEICSNFETILFTTSTLIFDTHEFESSINIDMCKKMIIIVLNSKITNCKIVILFVASKKITTIFVEYENLNDFIIVSHVSFENAKLKKNDNLNVNSTSIFRSQIIINLKFIKRLMNENSKKNKNMITCKFFFFFRF